VFHHNITDDYSRYGYIYLMKHKSESIKGLKNSEVKLKNKLKRVLWYLNLMRW
jgi:hypothetical protein